MASSLIADDELDIRDLLEGKYSDLEQTCPHSLLRTFKNHGLSIKA